MKKTKIILLSIYVATSITLFSCSSNKDIQQTPIDSYEDSSSIQEIKQRNKKTQTNNNKTSKIAPIQNKSLTESLQDMFALGNTNKFIRPDESTVFATSITGSIKQQKSTIFISTKDELSGFGSPYMSAYYIILMDSDARNKLAIAYENYLSDFNNKKLERKNSKNFRKYGNINVTLNWGTISTSTPNYGSGTANLGYEFVKNSPYFTINCFPMLNGYYDIVKESTSRESMKIKYYFTKAQMSELLSMISEEKIQDYLYESIGFDIEEADDIELDEYDEEYLENE